MNWTGGRLQQSRRSRSAVNAKQQAHFARARARLQNGHMAPPPPRLSILEEYQPEYRPRLAERDDNITPSPARTSQMEPDDYNEFAHVVGKKPTMDSHRNSIRQSPSPGGKYYRPVSRTPTIKNTRQVVGDLPTVITRDEGNSTATPVSWRGLYLTRLP